MLEKTCGPTPCFILAINMFKIKIYTPPNKVNSPAFVDNNSHMSLN